MGKALALGVVLCVARSAFAAPDQVDPFFGTFHHEAPIEVPAFHGVEPRLALTYNSATGNGFVGVGWTLDGFDVIERAGAGGRGAPRYDASDTYLLAGMLLLPCQAGSTSPSCAAGGTHATRIESYQRVRFDAGANTWTITDKDGTARTFVASLVTDLGVFRWGLARVEDRSGNAVTYDWWCDPGADCYPDAVRYNGAVVRFYREARPDPNLFATGRSVVTTRYRLRSVDVTVSGARARALRLEYRPSAPASRSSLLRITSFGRDAQVDGQGAITAGTSLPPMRFQTPPASASFAPEQSWAAYDALNNWSGFFTADVTGDGKDDLVYLDDAYTLNGWRVMASTGTGFAAPQNWGAYDGINGWGQFWVRDVNGDAKADLVYLDDAYTVNGYRVMLSTGTSFLPPQNWGAYDAINNWAGFWVVDVNGDDKADLLYLDDQYTVNGYRVMLSTGTRFAAPQNWGAYDSLHGWAQTRVADVTGDGRPDLVYLDDQYTVNGYRVMANLGNAFATPRNWAPFDALNSWSAWWITDVTGDGKADMLYLDDAYTVNGYRAMISTGSSFGAPQSWGAYDPVTGWAQTWVTDVNGDGRRDLLYLQSSWAVNGYRVMLSAGDRFAAPQSWGTYDTVAGWQTFRIADPSGDGLPDLVYLDDAHAANGYRVKVNRAARDLVTTVETGMGAVTTVGYAPSTRWSNTFLPAGLVAQTVATVTASDGRGTSSTTSYSYQGGLWSSAEQRFLGFRKVTTVLDAAGNTAETFYHQHVGCIAKPEVTYYRDGAGKIFSYTSYTYAESAAPPYTSLMTERWEMECNLGAACRRVVAQLDYDTFGNVLTTKEWGDYDVVGDETTTLRAYFPNLTTYVVSRPAYENVYAGIGTSGALQKQTLFTYDGAASYTAPPPTRGKVTSQARWNSQTGGYVTQTYAYDAVGNLVAETDELGHQKSYTYDAQYRVQRVARCDALGHCQQSTFDPVLGTLLTETDANGNVHAVTYDALGRIASETNPGTGTTTWQYVAWGDPTAQHIRQSLPDGSADGLWAEQYFDGAMRPIRWRREGGMERLVVYSGMTSRVWKESAWYAPATEAPRFTVHAYDGAGRRVRTTNPDGTFAEVAYENGAIVRSNEVGDTKVERFDGAGRVVQAIEYEGTAAHVTQTRRDALGRVVMRVDARGNVSTTSWDSLDRRLSTCDANTGCSTYTYDAAGRVATATDAKGQSVTLSYDATGRALERVGSDGSQTSWRYDEPGRGANGGERATSVSWAGGSDAFFYDPAGRTVSNTRCVLGQCRTQAWSYDALGRQAQTVYPDGEVVRWTYDSAGRLSSVPGYVSAMSWNARDQLVVMTYANGVTQSYTYDDARSALLGSSVVGATALYQASYGYDAAGRVTSVTSSVDATKNATYRYDSLGRLVSVAGARPETFAYDAIGNVTSSSGKGSYQYADPLHPQAVTAAGGAQYTYDANGNMTGGGGRTFLWDLDNRLVSATAGGTTWSFTYDPDGSRTSRQSAGGITRTYGALFEVTPDGSTVSTIFAGPMQVARKSSAEGVTFVHQDRLGSIELLTSATGAVAHRYGYTAFGQLAESSGAPTTNRRGFQGHDTEAELGLVYMNARYYDPSLGRFISADSLIPDATNPQALNRYAFAYNNPICNTDPTGHVPVVAALITAVTVNSTVAWIGFAFTAVGYFSKDPLLMTIGSVLTGFASGAAGNLLGSATASGLLGASVAAATSPLSPLDPSVKSALGWVYSAATFVGAQVKALREIEERVAYGRQLLAESDGLDLLRQVENPDAAAATVGEIYNHVHTDWLNAPPQTAAEILRKIIANGDTKVGMVGLASSSASPILDDLFGWIPSMRLHGILHDAWGFARIDFSAGPGYYGTGGAGPWASFFLSTEHPLTGQIEGMYATGNFNLFGGLVNDASIRRFRR